VVEFLSYFALAYSHIISEYDGDDNRNFFIYYICMLINKHSGSPKEHVNLTGPSICFSNIFILSLKEKDLLLHPDIIIKLFCFIFIFLLETTV
jgi:hypothetical protein